MDGLLSEVTTEAILDFAYKAWTILLYILQLVQDAIASFLDCNVNYQPEEEHPEEKEDLSSILIFIMIVKCLPLIGKILNPEDDD